MSARRLAPVLLVALGCTERADTTTTEARSARPSLVLFATGDVGGDTEQCGCKARPMGGIARRAKVMRDRSAGMEGRTLVADAGDLLFKSTAIAPRDEAQAHETAEFLAASMRMLDAAPVMAVGERDLALGLGTLRRVAAKNELRLLAANLVHARTGTAAFPGWTIVERGGTKVGFVGAALELDPKTPAYATLYAGNGLEVKPADAAVAEAAKAARQAGAELVVGLFHLGKVRAKELLTKLEPGLVDFAIVAHDRHASTDFEPVVTSGLILPGERGKWVLAVNVDVIPGARGVQNAGAVEAAKKTLADLDKRIAEYEKNDPESAGLDPAVAAKVAQDRQATLGRLQKRREQLAAEMAQVANAKTEARHPVKADLIPLDIALPEDPEMLAALDRYKARLAEVNAGTGRAPAGTELRYAGNSSCKPCHLPAFEHWRTTGHAKAWATMVRTKQTGNLDCIGCHTTGFDRPGGPSGLAGLESFRDVGCESCHGPGSLHVEVPETPMPLAGAALERTCGDCHKAQADQKPFVLPERLARVLGPGHEKRR